MSTFPTPCIRHLEPTQVLMLSEAAPTLLTVTDGTLWLTRGDGDGIILVVGDCAGVSAGDTPVASALGTSTMIEVAALESMARAA